MPFTTAGLAAPRHGRVASAAALTSILLVTGCGGSGGGTTSASTPSSSTSSSTTVPPADLPGLSDLEATLTTMSADETLSSAARKLSDTRSDLADNMTDMRAAVKAALDQRKAARWDCGPLDAKRSATWSIRTKVTESLDAGDTAYDKLVSTLKTFSGKVDDVSAAYDKLEKSASSLSASDAVSSRLDSAGTTIQAIAAQVTGAKASLKAAKDAFAEAEESADKQYATTRTLVDQCNAHWQHIQELKDNKK